MPVISYLVCATPRSGSTLLCETLRETGVAGNPQEFFEAVPETGVPRRPLDYLRGLEDDEALALVAGPPAARAAVLLGPARRGRRARAPRPRARVGHHAERRVRGQDHVVAPRGPRAAAWASDDLHALVDREFDRPRLVWVRREDTVRQAVSLWRAMQTQSWRAENEAATGEPRYSFAALRHLVEQLEAHDAAWERFLAGAAAPVLALTYEEVAADPADAVRAHARAHRRGRRAVRRRSADAPPGGRALGRVGGALRARRARLRPLTFAI